MPTHSEPRLIRSHVVPFFVAHARATGAPIADVLARHGIESGALPREIDLPLADARAIADALADRLGEPFLGLRMATSMTRGFYGLLEFSIRNAPDVHQALQRLLRYSTLMNDLVAYSIEQRDGDAIVEMRIAGEPLCLGRHANELALAIIVRIARETLRVESWSPRRVWFAHPPPEDPSELLAFFGVAHIDFGMGSNGIAFDAAELERSIPDSDPALLSVLDEQAQALLAGKSTHDDPLWARLREQVRMSLRDGTPRLSDVARALRMSGRTLQRRLDERETKFHDVVEEIRRDLSIGYLDRPDLAIGEVAFLLGYADLRAFTRAFKRWKGVTPTEHRAARMT